MSFPFIWIYLEVMHTLFLGEITMVYTLWKLPFPQAGSGYIKHIFGPFGTFQACEHVVHFYWVSPLCWWKIAIHTPNLGVDFKAVQFKLLPWYSCEILVDIISIIQNIYANIYIIPMSRLQYNSYNTRALCWNPDQYDTQVELFVALLLR